MYFTMMSPVSNQYASDTESLQTDVMRFMAIIGFCLIAILALVRNAEPTPATASGTPEQTVEAQTVVKKAASAQKIAQPKVLPQPAPAIEPARPAQLVAAVSSPVERETHPVVESTPEPRLQPATETPSPERASSPAPEPIPEPAATPAEEQGLILRFASDGDFLRLIARGDITVYAFLDTDVLSLDESYRFLDSKSPGQVYELLRASIPDHIIAALRHERSGFRDFRWGIALPSRISHQIEQYLERVEHGQLVINRFGDVRHVAAS
jgi:hypothetical protein